MAKRAFARSDTPEKATDYLEPVLRLSDGGLISVRLLKIALTLLPLLAACSQPDSSARPGAAETREDLFTSGPPSFVNRVWVVAESGQVAPGELRAFLSEGTLVMASPHGRPALGTWRYDQGQLTITEEGIRYPVDILELDARTFKIRIRGPGEPVIIRFAPAKQPLPSTAQGNDQRSR